MAEQGRLEKLKQLETELRAALDDADPKSIAAIARRCLAPQGKGIVEINELLGKETEALFREAGYPLTEVVKDFYEKNRFIIFEK